MLPGVTPFPPEFAARYRARGYWEDRTIASVWEDYCRLYADRVAVIDGDIAVSYAELNARATNLALNLLDLGIKPLDRLVIQLPNRIQFVYLYLALQKIGAIPVMALPAHRYLEISQFVGIAGAIGCVSNPAVVVAVVEGLKSAGVRPRERETSPEEEPAPC